MNERINKSKIKVIYLLYCLEADDIFDGEYILILNLSITSVLKF